MKHWKKLTSVVLALVMAAALMAPAFAAESADPAPAGTTPADPPLTVNKHDYYVLPIFTGTPVDAESSEAFVEGSLKWAGPFTDDNMKKAFINALIGICDGKTGDGGYVANPTVKDELQKMIGSSTYDPNAVAKQLAALGSAICSRVGVFNVALEAQMLIGCFFSIAVNYATGSLLLAVGAGILSGALVGLVVGGVVMTGVMLLWNYLITPIYMGYPRAAVAELLLPAFLPFNLLKGGLNAAIAMLLYKPVATALRKAGLAPESTGDSSAPQRNLGVTLAALVALATCVLLVLVMKDVI